MLRDDTFYNSPMRYYLWVFLALFLPLSSYAAEPLRIVAFGDSLVRGPYLAPEQTFPSHLMRELSSNGMEVDVINAGMDGETSAQGLRRIKKILRYKPDMVIVALGANDMLRKHDPAKAYKNLSQIIVTFKKENIPVLLAGVHASNDYPEHYQKRFNRIYSTLAEKYNVKLYPVFLEGVANTPALKLKNGIHPNGKGNALIAKRIAPYVRQVLR